LGQNIGVVLGTSGAGMKAVKIVGIIVQGIGGSEEESV
jgi:hypothetical protein